MSEIAVKRWVQWMAVVLAILFVCPVLLYAVNPQTPLSQYAHTAWRLEDGLLSTAPTAIAQTKDGYIWIGTNSDLLRFDGVKFTPWQDATGQQPVLGPVTSLLGASDGSLWIGTSVGLQHWDGRTLTDFRRDKPAWIAQIAEGDPETVWVARVRQRDLEHFSLCRVISGKMQCFGPRDGFANSDARSVVRDEAGNIWTLGTSALTSYGPQGITNFPIAALNTTQGLSSGSLQSDGHGGLWAGFFYSGHNLGLEHFRNGKFESVRLPNFNSEDLEVSCMMTDSDDTLWIGTTRNGIYRIHHSLVEHMGIADGMSGDAVEGFLKDREGNVWVTTTKGLDRFHDLSILKYTTQQHMLSDMTVQVLVARDGSVWARNHGGINILRGADVSGFIPRSSLPGRQATSFFQDRSGSVWLGIDNSVYRYKDGRFALVTDAKGRSLFIVNLFRESSDGGIWFTAYPNRNLYRLQPGSQKEQLAGPPDLTVLDMEPDNNGGLWVLASPGIVGHFKDGRFEPFQNKWFEQNHPRNMLLGPDGALYLWANGNLMLIRGSESRTIVHLQKGLCADLTSWSFDAKGNLWVGSRCGLTRFLADEVKQWWTRPETLVSGRLVLDGSDGFASTTIDFHPSEQSTPDGKLWFASDSGLLSLDPAHLPFNAIPPPVLVEAVIADHKKIQAGQSPVLPSQTRDLEIDYTALSFVSPLKVLFRYKLDGHDTSWQDAGIRRQAFYTDLPPGHYSFHVIACNNSGLWNENGATLNFYVKPAWFQTLWFHLAAGVLVLLILLSAYLLRVRMIAERIEMRVNERMSERLRISRELHDTLLQAIQGIVLRFSSLVDRVSPDVQGEMERSLDDAESLLVSGRDRIKQMRGQFSDEADITLEIQTIAATLFANHRCKVSVEAKGTPQPLKAIAYEEIVWIAREAMTNSCRHSKAETLTLQLSFTPGSFRMSIQDDGIGLGANAFSAYNRGHFGLVSMRERAEGIGGRLNVSSESGRGTLVNFSLPGRAAYIARRKWLRDLITLRFR